MVLRPQNWPALHCTQLTEPLVKIRVQSARPLTHGECDTNTLNSNNYVCPQTYYVHGDAVSYYALQPQHACHVICLAHF